MEICCIEMKVLFILGRGNPAIWLSRMPNNQLVISFSTIFITSYIKTTNGKYHLMAALFPLFDTGSRRGSML